MSKKRAGFMAGTAIFGAISVAAAPPMDMAMHQPGGQAVAAPAPAPIPAAKPRNVIFILMDDLRYDGMGFVQPQVKTPNIDKLAAGGMYFPNAVATSSLCSPARATVLTGMTLKNHGIVDNNAGDENSLTYFPQYLKQAGYTTAFFGKWHMGANSDAPRPGFDRWVSFLGQGSYNPGPNVMLNVDGQRIPQTKYITYQLNDYAMDWLKNGRDKSKPFFLYLSEKAVHSDRANPAPAERYAHQYDGVNFTLPASMANTPQNYKGKPLWVYNQRNSWHGVDYPYNGHLDMESFLRNYYATLSAVDESIGNIMNYLRANGLERDTMVIFTSDQGFQIGEHGLIDKRDAYEPSIRMPFVVYEPGVVPAGVKNPARIRNLDLAPTFTDIAGVPKPKQFEGMSLLSLFNGTSKPEDWKSGDLIYEYYWEYNFPMTPTTFAIERDGLKYITYYGLYDTDELYDVNKDPDEMNNLIDDPAYAQRLATLRRALGDQLVNAQGQHAIRYSPKMGRGMVLRSTVGSGPAPAYPDSWMMTPAQDAARAARGPLLAPDAVGQPGFEGPSGTAPRVGDSGTDARGRGGARRGGDSAPSATPSQGQ